MSLRARLSRVLRRGPPGHVEILDAERVAGWVVGPGNGQKPALVTLHVDGHLAMNLRADRPRADVLEAGAGPLHCGFDARMPRILADGQAHLVELRLGEGGPLLRGGRLRIPPRPVAAGSPAPAPAEAPPPAPVQGLAWFDRRRAALTGWATGCGAVSLRIDGAAPVVLRLDREVAGFGGGARQGFRHVLPPALMDGAWHQAEIAAEPGGQRLDGSPLRFRLSPGHPRAEIAALDGLRLRLVLRDAAGNPAPGLPVEVQADGVALALTATAEGCAADLPPGARLIEILDAGVTPPEPLSRHLLTPGQPPAELPAYRPALPPDALSPARAEAARAAFAAFLAAPDARFDALWYGLSHGLPADAALADYAGGGAAAGRSPGPFFDEAAARRLHPDLAAAVAAGDLPCAFALELVLGPGALGSLTGFAPEAAARLAALPLTGEPGEDALPPSGATPRPVHARLPAPAFLHSPADCIHAAWMARLATDAETRAALAADEAAMRHAIAAAPLTRRPLVSVIMPSFNRAHTLGEAVQSVLDQSYPHWELLVCDDASEDRTPEVMRGFSDPRIRFMQFLKSNGAQTRNKGLAHAKGELIAYLDSDNLWHPLFLDMMLRQLLARPGHAMAYCGYLDTEIHGAKVELQRVVRAPFRQVQLASKNFIDLNTILHHRRLYDWLGGFDPVLPRLQDWDLALRYTAAFPPVVVPHAAVFYRRNVAWGQVTHLFQDSGAQDRVNEKTARRLAGEAEAPAILWPGRPRLTLLLGGTAAGEGALVQSLATRAAALADVTLLDLTGTRNPPPDAPYACHAVPAPLAADPWRLGHAFAGLLQDGPVLSVGLREDFLQAIPGLCPARAGRVVMDAHGVAVQGLSDPAVQFHLGALPVDLPPARPETASALVIVSRGAQARLDEMALQTRGGRLALIVPPAQRGQPWHRLAEGRAEPLDDPATALASCALAASLVPLPALSPHDFSLLVSLQGRGLPLALPRDGARPAADSLMGQWLEARAVYEIREATPKWLADKLGKLQADAASRASLSERGRRVHAISFAPAALGARLADLLYRLNFDPPRAEVLDDRA